MLFEQAYLKYLQKVERNGLNDNISTERGRFVLLFNESQNKMQEWLLDRRGEDEIHYIQKVLVKDTSIPFSNKTANFYNFALPKNYFDFANAWAECSRDTCKKIRLDLFKMKPEDEDEILDDENNKPSFLWREAPFTISSDKINVYYDDFQVDKINLSYYRIPLQMALIDPEDPESDFLALETEFDDKLTDRIISMAAGEFELNNENPIFAQQKQRAATKI